MTKQSAGFWRRPTLAQPIVVLPSGLQRFTAVFGMGTGGATALVSPEIYPESFRGKFLVRDPRFETRGSESFRRITIHDSRISIHQRFTVHSVKERQFSDIYIRGRDSRFVTPLQRFPDSRFNALTIHEFEEHFRASFCFEIICLFC